MPSTKIIVFLLWLILFPLLLMPINVSTQNNTQQKYEILVENNRFVPNKLIINVGDIVTFVWGVGATGHNVAQTNTSTSTTFDNGFRSGLPQDAPANWTVPSEFVETNVTLFYICQPHVLADSMRGVITVGSGSDLPSPSSNNALIWLAIIGGSLIMVVIFILFVRRSA